MVWRPPFKGSAMAAVARKGKLRQTKKEWQHDFDDGEREAHDDLAIRGEFGRSSLPVHIQSPTKPLQAATKDDDLAGDTSHPPDASRGADADADDDVVEIRPESKTNAAVKRMQGTLRRRVTMAMEKGNLPLVETFITTNIRTDDEGCVLVSPVKTAATQGGFHCHLPTLSL